jgi:uncharacterized protein YbaA (DUF1428 family)
MLQAWSLRPEHTPKSRKVWRDHGALDYVACIADNVNPGKHASFPQAVKLKPGEVVWFSWIL